MKVGDVVEGMRSQYHVKKITVISFDKLFFNGILPLLLNNRNITKLFLFGLLLQDIAHTL